MFVVLFSIKIPQAEAKVIISDVSLEESVKPRVHLLAVKYGLENKEELMNNIIRCESGFDPYSINENKKNGKVWSTDRGLLQINDFYHQNEADKMGFNLLNVDDSLEYGFVLFKKQGTKPWNPSKNCWILNTFF